MWSSGRGQRRMTIARFGYGAIVSLSFDDEVASSTACGRMWLRPKSGLARGAMSVGMGTFQFIYSRLVVRSAFTGQWACRLNSVGLIACPMVDTLASPPRWSREASSKCPKDISFGPLLHGQTTCLRYFYALGTDTISSPFHVPCLHKPLTISVIFRVETCPVVNALCFTHKLENCYRLEGDGLGVCATFRAS